MLANSRGWCGLALFVIGSLYGVQAAPASPLALLVHKKRFAEAADVIAVRLSKNPDDAPALAARVDLILAQGQSERVKEAKAVAERCVAANPDSSLCAEALGNALGEQQGGWFGGVLVNTRALAKAYERAVLLDPTNYRARVALARFYLRTPFFLGGSTVRASELALEVKATNPDLMRLILALCARSEHRLRDAEEYVLAADLRDYELVEDVLRELLAGLAGAHLDAGRHADSRRLYGELHRRLPSSEAGSYGLGLVARAQGDQAAAATFLERAAAIAPRAYVYKTLGETYEAMGKPERALQAYRMALEAKPAPGQWERDELGARVARLRQR